MTEKRAVVLVSGGIDSAVLLAHEHLNTDMEPYPLHFSHTPSKLQPRRGAFEFNAARDICLTWPELERRFHSIAIPWADISNAPLMRGGDEELKNPKRDMSFVPARNLIFASIALSYAVRMEAKFICIGSQDDDVHPDNSMRFRRAFNKTVKEALGVGYGDVMLTSPLGTYNKEQLISYGVELGVPFQQTITCYAPKFDMSKNHVVSCGMCAACVKRAKAFADAGIMDPAHYQSMEAGA